MTERLHLTPEDAQRLAAIDVTDAIRDACTQQQADALCGWAEFEWRPKTA